MTNEEKTRAERLRDVAWTLDKLTDLTRCLLEPIAALGPMNAATGEITVEVTRDGKPMPTEVAQKILAWVNGDAMQNDLRAFADELESPDLSTQRISQ